MSLRQLVGWLKDTFHNARHKSDCPSVSSSVLDSFLLFVRPSDCSCVRSLFRTLVLHTLVRSTVRRYVRPSERPSDCPCLRPSALTSLHPFVYPTIRSTVRAWVCPTDPPFVRRLVCPTVRPSDCLFDRSYIRSSVRPSVRPSSRPPIRPTVRASVRACVRSSVCIYCVSNYVTRGLIAKSTILGKNGPAAKDAQLLEMACANSRLLDPLFGKKAGRLATWLLLFMLCTCCFVMMKA